MIAYGKLLNKEVKRLAAQRSWLIWFCHNDKNKNHRRLSYHRNGWRVPKQMKQDIKSDVELLLKRLEITGKIYWIESLHFTYGTYDKLCIEIPN